MAAIDLRKAVLPTSYLFTPGTTWQEVQLPPRCRVTVTMAGADGELGFARNGTTASPEEPADGGAQGSHFQNLPADALVQFDIVPDTANPGGQSIFLATQNSATACSVSLTHLVGG